MIEVCSSVWGLFSFFMVRYGLCYPYPVIVTIPVTLTWIVWMKTTGIWLNIMMPSYQYRKSHRVDKTILWPFYLHIGISLTSKMTSLHSTRALVPYFNNKDATHEHNPWDGCFEWVGVQTAVHRYIIAIRYMPLDIFRIYGNNALLHKKTVSCHTGSTGKHTVLIIILYHRFTSDFALYTFTSLCITKFINS